MPEPTPPRPRGLLCALGLALALTACSDDGAPPAPPSATSALADLPRLPGTDPGQRQWFWRNVLAAPLEHQIGRVDLSWQELDDPAAIIDALASIPEDGSVAEGPSLLPALRHPIDAVACVAAAEVGRRGIREAIPRLLKGLGPHPVDFDIPVAVRAAEASALARLGHPAGVPFLITVLSERTDEELSNADLPWMRTQQVAWFQELAIDGIVALAGHDFGDHPTAPIPHRAEAVRAMKAWWDENKVDLWAATAPLTDPDLILRTRLMVANLGAYQLRQIDGARFTLHHIGPGVLPYLEEGLASDDRYIRLHSLEIMERMTSYADAALRARLVEIATAPLASDDSTAVAAQAASLAASAGGTAPLIDALGRADVLAPEVLLAVVDGLGRTRTPEALTALTDWGARVDLTAGLPDLRAAHEAALLRLDPARSPDALLAMFGPDDPSVAFAALERLIDLTNSDHGVDALAPSDEALAAARAALGGR